MKVKSLSRVRLSVTPLTAAYQAPPSMGFSRQEYWSGVPLPSPNLEESFMLFRLRDPGDKSVVLLGYTMFQILLSKKLCSNLYLKQKEKSQKVT